MKRHEQKSEPFFFSLSRSLSLSLLLCVFFFLGGVNIAVVVDIFERPPAGAIVSGRERERV